MENPIEGFALKFEEINDGHRYAKPWYQIRVNNSHEGTIDVENGKYYLCTCRTNGRFEFSEPKQMYQALRDLYSANEMAGMVYNLDEDPSSYYDED